MTFALVQKALSPDDPFTSLSSRSLAFPSTVGSGDAVAVLATWDLGTSANISSVTDDKGNTYTLLARVDDTTDGAGAAVYYCLNITNAPKTITVNWSAACQFQRIAIDELGGVGTSLGGSASHLNPSATTATDNVTSTSITTTVPCLIWSGAACGSSSNTFTAGTGFTLSNVASGSDVVAIATEYFAQGSAGAKAGTFTVSNAGIFEAFVIAFQAPGGSSKTFSAACTDSTAYTSSFVRNKRAAAAANTDSTAITAALRRVKSFGAACTDTMSCTAGFVRNKRAERAALSVSSSITASVSVVSRASFTAALTITNTDTCNLGKIRYMTPTLTVISAETAVLARSRSSRIAAIILDTNTATLARKRPLSAAEVDVCSAALDSVYIKVPYLGEAKASTTWTNEGPTSATWTDEGVTPTTWIIQSNLSN